MWVSTWSYDLILCLSQSCNKDSSKIFSFDSVKNQLSSTLGWYPLSSSLPPTTWLYMYVKKGCCSPRKSWNQYQAVLTINLQRTKNRYNSGSSQPNFVWFVWLVAFKVWLHAFKYTAALLHGRVTVSKCWTFCLNINDLYNVYVASMKQSSSICKTLSLCES